MAFNFKFQSILNLKIRIEDQKKSKYGEANEELKRQIIDRKKEINNALYN